jgi:hypothetical protein
MKRKRWTPQTEITPDLLSFREKKKWQINFRRYVVQKMACPAYAPYFGLDIQSIRQWFERQFTGTLSWENFGKAWQFEHIVPLGYFDHGQNADLELCWNFTNIRVAAIGEFGQNANGPDILGAKAYFRALEERTGYPICKRMLEKIQSLENAQIESASASAATLENLGAYLRAIEGFGEYEFERLNAGASPEEIKKEIQGFKEMGAGQ